MNKKQLILIVGLALLSLVMPSFTVGLCLMCAAVGAFVAVALS